MTQQKNSQGNSDQGESGSSKGNTSNRGFASMDQEKQREIASQGGRAAHEKGTAHEFTSEEARAAGSKGGRASHSGGSQGGNSNNQGNQNDNQGQGRSNSTQKETSDS